MPKIKAYKGNGAVIPVDESYLGTAYRCPWTDKIFSYKSDYINHLTNYREHNIRYTNRMRDRTRILNGLWTKPDWDGVIDWMNNNPQFILDMGSRHAWRPDDVARAREKFKFKITYLKIAWSNRVCNSHDCPHNGVQNWGGDKKDKNGTPLPTGYPGWEGRIEFTMTHDLSFGSRILEGFRIHTGGGGGYGGGLGMQHGYQVRLYDADWPGITQSIAGEREAHQSVAVMERLLNHYTPPFRKEFNYGEPKYFKH